MARTESKMLPLGTKAPDFNLPDTVTGSAMSLSEISSSTGTVVMFICNHCPYVIHVVEQMSALASEYKELGFSFVAISSNDVENYPDDSPDKMKTFAAQYNFSFPYLYDESQEIAKAYDAACTPDFYIFDGQQQLVYRGRLDGSRPKTDDPVTGEEMRAALDAILLGRPVSTDQFPSMGCNIKWKN